MQHFEAIPEASYLSVPNAPVYRKIMRLFYREYEKMHFQLYKEDVLALLRADGEYEEYTMEELLPDLDALARWKNLTPIQDPGRVYTIADYKNKQYRYTMTENAVEIERMTVRLEKLFLESGNLSMNFFVRLEKSLEDAQDLTNADDKDINAWWTLMQEDFRRLNQNYQDYLRDFYSGRSEHLMKSVEFVIHKDKFITYLNEFVRELQRHSGKIEAILSDVRTLIEEKLLEKVVRSELAVPHADTELRRDRESEIRENIYGKWESLKRWFLEEDGRECECRKVLRITNDVIRNIIQNAALLVQLRNWGISRKDDYRKFLDLFRECASLEEAHRLSAHVFGIQQIQHFKSNAPREEDSVSGSVYEEEPVEYCLKPHTRAYREKKDRRGFTDRTFEKMIERQRYLDEAHRQKALVLRYIRNGRIEFSRIEDVISGKTRQIFLMWISQANMNSGRKGRTEYGQEFRLRRGRGKCVLKCEDGNLTMPAYVLEFSQGDI